MTNYKDGTNGLIGYTGFIGGNLFKQKQFPFYYNSQNIDKIEGKTFDLLVCTGARGFKWIANKYPLEDHNSINKLITCLSSVRAKHLVLISTIDVYHNVNSVNEDTCIKKDKLSPYGLHRWNLENFVESNFHSTIIRLPGIFGLGMKGGLIYDYIHKNYKFIPQKGLVQFYNLNNLWGDIIKSVDNNLNLVNFSTEPIRIKELTDKIFYNKNPKIHSDAIPHYNMQTKHSSIWGKDGYYLYSKKEITEDIIEFVKIINKSKNI
tara:strand:+ start:18343 stop:19131 length:789 start_codon:yes stop_codon:yes gene_type:complete